MSTLYNMGDLSKKFADKIKNSKSPIEQSKSIKEAAKTFKEANSFIMGGKKMVLDRGRYKEGPGKTGSWSREGEEQVQGWEL